MMTHEEYRKNQHGTALKHVEAMRKYKATIADLEAQKKSGTYSPQYIKDKINPKLDEARYALKKELKSCREDAERLYQDYLYDLDVEFSPKGSDLTADIELLTNHAVKLTAAQIEQMAQRPENRNASMCQCLRSYAEQHKLRVNPAVYSHGNANELQAAAWDTVEAIKFLAREGNERLADSSIEKLIQSE